MKIGLLGFDFQSPNKGCEALTYSFIDCLCGFNLKDLEIHVFGYSELGCIPQRYPSIKFVNHRLHMKNPLFWVALKRKFDDMSCIFDITFGDGFSDIYGKKWNALTNLVKQIAIFSSAPFILLPQTYGPYESVLLTTHEATSGMSS